MLCQWEERVVWSVLRFKFAIPLHQAACLKQQVENSQVWLPQRVVWLFSNQVEQSWFLNDLSFKFVSKLGQVERFSINFVQKTLFIGNLGQKSRKQVVPVRMQLLVSYFYQTLKSNDGEIFYFIHEFAVNTTRSASSFRGTAAAPCLLSRVVVSELVIIRWNSITHLGTRCWENFLFLLIRRI